MLEEETNCTFLELVSLTDYGNWCGLGNNGREPVDEMDACCKVCVSHKMTVQGAVKVINMFYCRFMIFVMIKLKIPTPASLLILCLLLISGREQEMLLLSVMTVMITIQVTKL